MTKTILEKIRHFELDSFLSQEDITRIEEALLTQLGLEDALCAEYDKGFNEAIEEFTEVLDKLNANFMDSCATKADRLRR